MTKAPDIYLDMSDLRHVFAGFALGIYTCFPEKRDEFAAIMRTWADTPSRTEAARLALHCLADDVDGTLPERPHRNRVCVSSMAVRVKLAVLGPPNDPKHDQLDRSGALGNFGRRDIARTAPLRRSLSERSKQQTALETDLTERRVIASIRIPACTSMRPLIFKRKNFNELLAKAAIVALFARTGVAIWWHLVRSEHELQP